MRFRPEALEWPAALSCARSNIEARVPSRAPTVRGTFRNEPGSLLVLNPCSHRCLLKQAYRRSDLPPYPRQYQTVSGLTIGRQGSSILVLELQVPCLCLTQPEMLKTPTSLDLPRPGCRVAFDTS